MSFASLGLSEALAGAVEAAGYTQPTPVQQRAIPAVLQGRDLMVAAQTGTGKTGGFALPVLELLFPGGHPDREHRYGPKQPRVLVLTPTRELAAQVHDSFKVYARDLPLKSAVIFGGVGMNPQIQAVAKGIDVLVACPGRLLDLANQKAIDLSHVEILVLDEADRMLDMGFIHDVKKVLAKLPAKRQNLLFSATFSKDITDLAAKLLQNPERIEVTPPNTTVERIEQRVFRVASPQAGPARPPDHPGCLGAGAGLHPYQARCQSPGRVPGEARPAGCRDPWQQEPECPYQGPGRLQGQPGAHPGGHRYRRPRPGHRPAAACGQLRATQRRGRLCAPHRPHRPRRTQW